MDKPSNSKNLSDSDNNLNPQENEGNINIVTFIN